MRIDVLDADGGIGKPTIERKRGTVYYAI